MTRALGSNPPPGIVVGLKQQPLGVLTSGVRLGGGGGVLLGLGDFWFGVRVCFVLGGCFALVFGHAPLLICLPGACSSQYYPSLEPPSSSSGLFD